MEDYDGFDPQRQRTATSMRSPDLQVILPGRTGKAQVFYYTYDMTIIAIMTFYYYTYDMTIIAIMTF